MPISVIDKQRTLIGVVGTNPMFIDSGFGSD